MTAPSLKYLAAFMAVAQEGSFTRAAATLGLSPSAVSHMMRQFEEQLGVRLLARTTRHVSLTPLGEQLMEQAGPSLEQIHQTLDELVASQAEPSGTLRVTTGDHQAERFLLPAIAPLLDRYPRLTIEISVDARMVDLVEERFDAGIRLGETLAQDMIAVPVGPMMSMAVVGSPDYFRRHAPPRTPDDLARHRCINLRFPTYGHLYAWEFEKEGQPFTRRVSGPLIVNDSHLAHLGACQGSGLACLPDDMVKEDIDAGRLIRVLASWCPPFPGYHLYYPSRRQKTPALAALIEALRAID
ncbi:MULTISPECIES: LysR family transcriptional regulator [unclassified Saccharibacter]|uniref:LysR family transcriptional regulator n=1 Tax=unclassified Saccharibacter TaxID=2648722 RepID=UPI00132946BB|nr:MULTISPECIES: LysR family transcriptional regulator [unclassified Saccharibacter]MXV36861.1 LysR family transcriptional regulator [Saccharibacter sp. EH611]MXV58649.1 LysR family transcriptional regulator [Saccharibacter sp. EH70]MXV66155.1 LysR family transcriptional regulator [Saccharibacter sp. EH60]